MNLHISFGVLIASLAMVACGSSTSPATSSTSAAATASGGTGPGGSATGGTSTGAAAGETTGTVGSGTGSGGGSTGSSTGGTSTGAPGFVSAFAGNGSSDGMCAAYGGDSSFSPLLLALDAAGNVYVSTANLDAIADGGQLTNLGTFTIVPNGLSATAAGVVYYSATANFSDETQIIRVMGMSSNTIFDAMPSSCADTGSDAGKPGVGSVSGIAADSAGNVYVSDGACFTIRKVTPAGAISTLAGTPGSQGLKNGPGSTAEFSQPGPIAIDPSGNLFVVDNNFVRKILPDGTTSTLGGGALEVGGIAADANGNVYFSDDQDSTIRKMDSSGRLTTIAGNGMMGYVNGTLGANGTSEFNTPGGVAVDGNGDIYVADTANCYVRIIHQ